MLLPHALPFNLRGRDVDLCCSEIPNQAFSLINSEWETGHFHKHCHCPWSRSVASTHANVGMLVPLIMSEAAIATS